ncbi:TPA: Hin recombinase [Klebsiella pneumoniae]|uniref:Hin recombinase n=1 Tax=Salmonella enterica subsp. enterica serovar Poona TaxID=436295 RepID=A0A731UPX9_SALET|nr:Hin recombinase [Klebsiella pneumoniae]EKZ5468286.1 Hin recombinase [Klebsiella quasipneumoniae]MBU9719423.1 Hin recombinase [Klebsiella pneumoniae subsp. ozaenae]HAE4776394.1 Hin recombinase [Salmonella enterica subsp. enterica serovar Poona]HDU4115123.1 Hin recombinase [Klebsiella pneumoniae subsp. pneumoniae]
MISPSRCIKIARARAKADGKRFGRPSSLNEEQQRAVIDRLNAGTTISAVAREFNTSRQTIIRVREGNQKRNAVLPDY